MTEDPALVEAQEILNDCGDEPLLSRIASALRAARAPAPSDAERVLLEALEWYAEKARALHRYGNKPIKPAAMEAVVTELMLDNGARALRAPQQPPSGDVREEMKP